MRLGTSVKLFLAILAACAVVLTANGVAGRFRFERDFMGYLNDQGVERMQEVLPRLQAAYSLHGNWDFVRDNPEAWFGLMRPGQPHAGMPLSVPPVSDQTGAVPRFALLDAQGERLIGNPNASSDAIRLPVTVDGRGVGWLAMVPFQRAIAAGDVRFYQAQVRGWWLNGIASVLVAALLAWLLSRALLGRVRGLTGAIHRLAAGDYAHRVARTGRDELGRLAGDINALADVLAHTERNRRSFMADISHELRTPLAVLRAELEAIQDGIRPMTPAALEPLQGEVQQLGKLIDDLHELSVTQNGALSYRFAMLDLDGVLQAALAAVRGRFADAGLALETAPAGAVLLIEGDERRLQQLFANLLENALRYTDAGGRVAARIQPHADRVDIHIEDSAPGVDAAHRERLFERFYRVEGSRNRASGGSGLGLAICRNIVEAHGGTIQAEASPLGGLRIVIVLPRRA
ncbi:sensor histidine kinase efflux regulator BaeS [Comamonadaceae bacterium PP-2]